MEVLREDDIILNSDNIGILREETSCMVDNEGIKLSILQPSVSATNVTNHGTQPNGNDLLSAEESIMLHIAPSQQDIYKEGDYPDPIYCYLFII